MRFAELLTAVELPPENAAAARAILRDEARAFLFAGGTLTLSDWGAMSELARQAFSDAARDVDTARADARALSMTQAAVAALRELHEMKAVNAAADAGVRAVSGGSRT